MNKLYLLGYIKARRISKYRRALGVTRLTGKRLSNMLKKRSGYGRISATE